MLSKPDGWNFTASSMASQLLEARKSILNTLNELKNNGYLTYEKQQSGFGIYKLNTKKHSTTPATVPKSQSGTMTPCRNGTLAINAVKALNTKKHSTTPATVPKSPFATVPKGDCISNTDCSSNKDSNKEKKKIKRKISYEEKVKNFEPTKATADTFKKKYPHFANEKEEYLKLLEQFKDQALNRKNPFVDLNAGMRNYINMEYIKPVKQVVRKNEISSYRDIGEIVRMGQGDNARTNLPKQILIDKK